MEGKGMLVNYLKLEEEWRKWSYPFVQITYGPKILQSHPILLGSKLSQPNRLELMKIKLHLNFIESNLLG